MDVFEAIENRHSYRGAFEQKPIPREDLKKMVQAGVQAPSGYNGQSTSFVIVDDGDLLRRISDIVGSKVVEQAPAVIVCVMDPEATRDKGLLFGVEDYAAAVENTLLAVTAMGYATVWIDGVLRREDRARRIGELCGVPEQREVRVILPVGRPLEEGRQNQKKPFEQRAWFNSVGG